MQMVVIWSLKCSSPGGGYLLQVVQRRHTGPLREAWYSCPASRPSHPIPTPQLCSQRQQGVRVGRAHVCGPGLTVTHKAEALRETWALCPLGGEDGVCCCQKWDDRAGLWEAASDTGVRSGRRFSPHTKLVTRGHRGGGGQLRGQEPCPGSQGGLGAAAGCPGVQAELGLLPSGGVWMRSLGGASQASIACVTLFPEALPGGRGPAPPQGPGAPSGAGLVRMGPGEPDHLRCGAPWPSSEPSGIWGQNTCGWCAWGQDKP